MKMIALFAATQAIMPAGPKPSVDEIAAAFQHFCVGTEGDRGRFDALVESMPALQKTSQPSLFSGVEFNRRWALGSIEIAFLDVPPPNRRQCSASGRGSFGEADVARIVSGLSGSSDMHLVTQVPGYMAWSGTTASGATVALNFRTTPGGTGDFSMSLLPTP